MVSGLVAVLAASISPLLAAGAERPTVDSTFVAASRPEVARILEAAAADPGPANAWQAVRRLYGLRQERLSRLAEIHGLHSVNGVATQDALDVEIVRALRDVTGASVQADTVGPDAQDAALLADLLADAPSLGEKPLGFMVMGFCGLAIGATDSLRALGAVSDVSAARMGLRLVSHAATVHVNAYPDPMAALGQNEFVTGAYLTRLRCPNDGSAYSMSNVRTRLAGGNSLYRVYDLVCPLEGTSFQIEFYQVAASRLYQMSPRQKIESRGEKRPSSGPDP
jgi:hypothetical protein